MFPATRQILIGFLALVPAGLMAQSGLRDGDRPYGAAELSTLLSGHAVEFHDGSIARYRDDGRYSYVYQDGTRPFLGHYRVTSDGAVCVDFDNGSARCDTYVDDGRRLVLIIAAGDRFPVRDRRVLAP